MAGRMASQQASMRSAAAHTLLPQQSSMRMMIALSTVLIVAGSFPVRLYFSGNFDTLPDKTSNHAVPVFVGFRQEDGNPFLESHVQAAPVLYTFFHAVPGIVWCLVVPSQHVARFRTLSPATHRRLGYVGLACSLVLALSGIAFVPAKLAYTHKSFTHVHVLLRIGRVPVLVCPTFAASLVPLFVAQLYCTFKTAAAARRRDIPAHKYWATALTGVGYAVPLQRVCMLAVMSLGGVLACLPRHVQALVNVPTHPQDIVDAERAAFALTAWVAFGCAAFFVAQQPKVRNKHVD